MRLQSIRPCIRRRNCPARKRLDSSSTSARRVRLWSEKKVGLEIQKIQKTEQMRLIQSPNSHTNPFTIKGQIINKVKGFKYLESYVGSTDRDVNVRIGLAWAAFAKLKSILRSPKVELTSRLVYLKRHVSQNCSTAAKLG